jgi:L-fuconolactonase
LLKHALFLLVGAVEPFRMTDHLSDTERAMLMGGACAKAYGWSPKKG